MPEAIERDCVIAGGGPAGMVLGYVLGRAGLRVTVLEKHADFLRDFRGDTIHPSTITTLGELGLRETFLRLPLSRLETLDVVLDGARITVVDFRRLRGPEDFLVFAPQWDFLNFLASEGSKLPGFEVHMGTSADELVVEDGRVLGVRATGPDGAAVEFRAPLTVSADGRGSSLRTQVGLDPVDFGVPIDVLWFSMPMPPVRPPDTLGYLTSEGVVLTIPRRDHIQSGTLIPKGGFEAVRAGGLDAFRERVARIAPVLEPVVGSLKDWDQVKLLSVQLNRLETWYRTGYIAIGDAAHAMSPVGGVGVNYAIQDAVALANLIAPALARGAVPVETLAALQRRRERPVKRMQAIQRNAHRVISRGAAGEVAPRWAVWLLRRMSPAIRGLTARFLGIGFLPEHVDARILRLGPDGG